MCAARKDSRSEILDAALALVREGGPEAATARAICDRAGVKQPTLYHYFGDLGGLRRAIVAAAFDQAIGQKRVVRQDDPYADIADGWDAYVRFATREPSLFALMDREISSGSLPSNARASLAELTQNYERLGARRTLRVSTTVAAQMTWATAHGIACLAAAGKAVGLHKEVSARLRELVLSSLVAE
jgi:AcrR family transcriptional regulator